MSGDVSPEEAVANFRQAVVKADHKQRIVINRKAESIVREALRIYKKQINIASEPDVEFENEDAIDATGLTREYFHLIMTALRNGSGNISLFEGCEGHVLPNHNAEAQASQLFFLCWIDLCSLILAWWLSVCRHVTSCYNIHSIWINESCRRKTYS